MFYQGQTKSDKSTAFFSCLLYVEASMNVSQRVLLSQRDVLTFELLSETSS